MPSDETLPSRMALRSLPYAVPVAAGIVCLAWGLVEFVSTITDAYWVAWELVPAVAAVTLGSGLLVVGAVGVLARVARSVHASPPG